MKFHSLGGRTANTVFSSTSSYSIFLLCLALVSQVFAKVSCKVMHFIAIIIIQWTARDIPRLKWKTGLFKRKQCLSCNLSLFAWRLFAWDNTHFLLLWINHHHNLSFQYVHIRKRSISLILLSFMSVISSHSFFTPPYIYFFLFPPSSSRAHLLENVAYLLYCPWFNVLFFSYLYTPLYPVVTFRITGAFSMSPPFCFLS